MNDFETIKQSLNIIEVITRETGLQMKGKHLEECPFCNGHTCFSIQEAEGFFKCFQCEAKGDIFNFLETYHKTDKATALQKAAELAKVQLKGQKRPKDVAGIKLTVHEKIFIDAARHYHENYPMNGGRSYLIEKRGHKEDSIKAMQVGWSEGNLVDFLRSQNYKDDQIKASGLAKEIEHDTQKFLVDYFPKNVAVFPHFDREKVLKFTFKYPQKIDPYQIDKKYWGDGWRFYNQNALRKFQEIIVVEGENDLLSVLDAGIEHVIATTGSPADYQIQAMKSTCASKHIYLWMDNDEDPENIKTKGKGYIRRICDALTGSANVRIITYPEDAKDPDEHIQKFRGDRKKEIQRLQNEAVDYITWEIMQISKKTSLEERLKALKDRKIFAAIANMVEAEKQVFVEKLEFLGFTKNGIEEQIDLNQELLAELDLYYEGLVNRKDADPFVISKKIFNYFLKNGKFFYNVTSTVYLFYKHCCVEVGDNVPFNSKMLELTRLDPTRTPGRTVWKNLESLGYSAGKYIDELSWIQTNTDTNTIYVNLNATNKTILKIAASGIEEIQNGINTEDVFLGASSKMRSVNYLPDASINEGFVLFDELLFKNFTCNRENMYLITCWLLSAFFLDYMPYMLLMKFSGNSESGKSTASKLISILLYGKIHLSNISTAGAYSSASREPLLILEDLEEEERTTTLKKFLRLSATGGEKEKRLEGTTNQTVEQKPKALILTNAIDPFEEDTIINRTADIAFHDDNKKDSFIEEDTFNTIKKNRDLILTSFIKFISYEILPNLDKRKYYIALLRNDHKKHAKRRMDEYLALLMLLLEKLVKYIPYYPSDHLLSGIEAGDNEIRTAWINYQNERAKQNEVTSSSIIKLFEGLVREYLAKMKDIQPVPHKMDDKIEEVFVYTHPEYLLEVVKTKPQTHTDDNQSQYLVSHIEFTGTSNDLLNTLDKYCKNNGLKNPYKSVSVFSSRLTNDRKLLEKGNWEIIDTPGKEPYFKIIRGERYWKFRKTVVLH